MSSSLDTARPASPARSRQPGLLLAGDIGGTKTALGVYAAEAGPRAPLIEAEFPSAKYSSLGVIVREFLKSARLPVAHAAFAVAGPVIGGASKVTNLSWSLEIGALTQELGLESVHLMNDLEAIAHAMTVLDSTDLYTLNVGDPIVGGARTVIAPGTGLGEAFLIYDGTRYRAFPSEGGHASFAPTNELEIGLLNYLRKQHHHVSVERACSGPGLYDIYQYLRDSGHTAESAELTGAITAAESAPALISAAGLRPNPDPLSRAALELFVAILGAEAGNLALKVLSTGGIYLAGGIPCRNRPVLEEGRFMRAFTAKGRFRELLSRIPVHVVGLRAALIGAAHRGLELVESQ